MSDESTSAPITVRTDKHTINAIDALAGAMDRSRNYVVNQAIRQYLDANTWQVGRIKSGMAAARKGKVRPADAVLAEIAAKHGWKA